MAKCVWTHGFLNACNFGCLFDNNEDHISCQGLSPTIEKNKIFVAFLDRLLLLKFINGATLNSKFGVRQEQGLET